MLQNSGATGFSYGGAVHAFTRDPSNYLVGITGAAIRTPGATVTGIGPEAELYLGQFSVEAWAGFDRVTYDDTLLSEVSGAFGFIDGVYYPTENWRLSLGASSVFGNNALHLATEYQFGELGFPLSATADARIGASGGSVFTVGLKGYFGGNDDNKSLIDRQRQDDPRNRALDLFAAAGSVPFAIAPTPLPPVDPETACLQSGGSWNPQTQICTPP